MKHNIFFIRSRPSGLPFMQHETKSDGGIQGLPPTQHVIVRNAPKEHPIGHSDRGKPYPRFPHRTAAFRPGKDIRDR